MNIKKFIRKDFQNLTTYISSPINNLNKKQVIKLDSGENSFVEKLLDKKRLIKSMNFYCYPDATATKLREKLAKYLKVDPERIICGNGSDELIDLLIRSFVEQNEEIIINPPTFSMYEFFGKLNRASIIKVLRTTNLEVNFTKLMSTISKKTKIVFIDSPGNPAGTVINQKNLVKLLDKKVIVVVDEAYYEYCNKTCLSLVERYPNLIILRTFSKWAGLAGLRLGYLIGNPIIIKVLNTIKPPYNVNVVAQESAVQVLNKLNKYKNKIREIIKIRKWFIQELNKLADVKVYSTESAYVVFRTNNKADSLRKYLFFKGIIVKTINQPLLEKCIRLSIDNKSKMKTVLSVIKEFYEN